MYKIPANTLFLGKNLLFMPECHSTNTFALDLCQQSLPIADGTVVITDNQTSGRGQRGNNWEVEPGRNLTFSVILKPTFLAVNLQFYLNIFTSLAIHDYLREKGCLRMAIKWPNDVFINEKKVSGILIENQVHGNLLANTVVGIGLNINQAQFLELKNATSLGLILNREFDLQSELEILLTMLEARYLQLRQGHLSGLMADYLRAMYWINEAHTFGSNGQTFEGIICGVDESGRLKLRINHEEKVFGMKEISYLR